jgi:hypothetical protein
MGQGGRTGPHVTTSFDVGRVAWRTAGKALSGKGLVLGVRITKMNEKKSRISVEYNLDTNNTA